MLHTLNVHNLRRLIANVYEFAHLNVLKIPPGKSCPKHSFKFSIYPYTPVNAIIPEFDTVRLVLY